MDDALRKKAHVSRMSVWENHPTWAKRTWSGHSGQAWSSLIHQWCAKKQIRKNFIFLQESILLTPSKFFRSVSCSAWSPKLRSTVRRAASSQVIFVPAMSKLFPNDVDLKDDMSPITLVSARLSLLNFVRVFRANRSPETSVLPRSRLPNLQRFSKAAMLPETWVHPRSSSVNSVRFFNASMSPETLVLKRSSHVNFVRFSKAEMSPETWVFLRLRTCRSGNSLKRELRVPVTSSRHHRLISTTLQSFLGWETPRRGRRSHGSRLCWQISIASFVSEKFSVSILASSQKWATTTP